MTKKRDDRGAVSVEFVLLLPLFALLIAVVVAGARVGLARSAVQQFADSASRQASISRTAAGAVASARQLVESDATSQGLNCVGGVSMSVDASGFGVPLGQPARVGATVRCSVALSDVVAPGMPGAIVVDATSWSTLDRYRGRG